MEWRCPLYHLRRLLQTTQAVAGTLLQCGWAAGLGALLAHSADSTVGKSSILHDLKHN